MVKILVILFCSLLLSFSNTTFAQESTQQLTKHAKLDRLKINLGDNLCNDTRLSKKNLLLCSTSQKLIMKSNWTEVIPTLESDPKYVEMFQKVYRGKITPENITDSIVEYEYSLVMPSRFDDYLHGNKEALTQKEIHGYELFKSYGCAVCHNGPNFGGSKFKKMGVAKNYLIEHRTLITRADFGLYEVTKNTNDVYVFKVPTLRNVGIMNSYYHDGSVKSLHEAVYLMGKYQLGVAIPEKNIEAIMAFLNSLTGKTLGQQKANEPVNK